MHSASLWLAAVSLLGAFSAVGGFVLSSPRPSRSIMGCSSSSTTALKDISEWRDQWYTYPGTGDDRTLGKESSGTPREICLLPFPFDEVLLQGEQKQLRLYEERFLKLFEHASKKNCGVVGMGLCAEAGIIQSVPLCEIEAFNKMDGFGIFMTIRVVSRAKILEVVSSPQDEFIRAVCVEVQDKIPPNLELPNLVASNIENFMLLLSSMEHRLSEAMDEENQNQKTDSNSDDNDDIMKKRIEIAKLEDRFYDDLGDDEDDEVAELDRRGRFRQAYRVALDTDTQGYIGSSSTGGGGGGVDRTPQELTALSWAAFCTNVLPEEDVLPRIQALDSDSLFDRLKLASAMLREKKNSLKTQMEKAGLKLKGDEGEDLDEQF